MSQTDQENSTAAAATPAADATECVTMELSNEFLDARGEYSATKLKKLLKEGDKGELTKFRDKLKKMADRFEKNQNNGDRCHYKYWSKRARELETEAQAALVGGRRRRRRRKSRRKSRKSRKSRKKRRKSRKSKKTKRRRRRRRK